jgi:hypothetical protein
MTADVRARWDAALLKHSETLTGETRRLRHLAERFRHAADPVGRRKALDEAHQEMRVACAQLHLLGDKRVQLAAHVVLHHAYSVRVEGEEGRDPRAADHPGKQPVARLNDALQEFCRAVRSQLNADDPENVVNAGDLEAIQPGLKPLSPAQRSQSR